MSNWYTAAAQIAALLSADTAVAAIAERIAIADEAEPAPGQEGTPYALVYRGQPGEKQLLAGNITQYWQGFTISLAVFSGTGDTARLAALDNLADLEDAVINSLKNEAWVSTRGYELREISTPRRESPGANEGGLIKSTVSLQALIIEHNSAEDTIATPVISALAVGSSTPGSLLLTWSISALTGISGYKIYIARVLPLAAAPAKPSIPAATLEASTVKYTYWLPDETEYHYYLWLVAYGGAQEAEDTADIYYQESGYH